MIYDRHQNSLLILNQLLLPLCVEYEEIKSTTDAWNAIKQMKVRGAPAIAILGLLSVAVELGQDEIIAQLGGDYARLLEYLNSKVNLINHSLYLCKFNSQYSICILFRLNISVRRGQRRSIFAKSLRPYSNQSMSTAIEGKRTFLNWSRLYVTNATMRLILIFRRINVLVISAPMISCRVQPRKVGAR